MSEPPRRLPAVPFERVRTQLAFGRRLHREHRRADARVPLRAALDGFDRLGAAPWTAQARNELRAAGGRRRPNRGPLGAVRGGVPGRGRRPGRVYP